MYFSTLSMATDGDESGVGFGNGFIKAFLVARLPARVVLSAFSLSFLHDGISPQLDHQR